MKDKTKIIKKKKKFFHYILASQPQTFNQAGTSLMLPSTHAVHNPVSHTNAVSPATFIASGSCNEQISKVSAFNVHCPPLYPHWKTFVLNEGVENRVENRVESIRIESDTTQF